jgi:hypothetical protein
VILTDGVVWEFFFFEFSYMCMWRGETNALDGYRDVSPSLPLSMKDSELADEHVDYLKIGNQPFLSLFCSQNQSPKWCSIPFSRRTDMDYYRSCYFEIKETEDTKGERF